MLKSPTDVVSTKYLLSKSLKEQIFSKIALESRIARFFEKGSLDSLDQFLIHKQWNVRKLVIDALEKYLLGRTVRKEPLWPDSHGFIRKLHTKSSTKWPISIPS